VGQLYFTGDAVAVAQISQVQITADDAATTYKITIGGVVVSISGSGTGVNNTASELATALNASTHPYFEAVTWSAAADLVTGVANVAGCPFVATSSVTGGAGTIGAVSTGTVSAGPNHWDTAANWSTGAVPVNGDEAILKDSAVNILWGLDQSAVTLDRLTIYQSYTGKLGLNFRVFATAADGESFNENYYDYREKRLKILVDSTQGPVEIGKIINPGDPFNAQGSPRISIDLGAQQADIVVFNTSRVSAEPGLPAVRIRCNNASNTLEVRNSPGGVGVGSDEPYPSSPGGAINSGLVTASDASSWVVLGPDMNLTTWIQDGGRCLLHDGTTITVNGGELTTEGEFTLTTATVRGGIYYPNHAPNAGVAITTAQVPGGTIDGTQSAAGRTWTTVTPSRGGRVIYDDTHVTITNLTTVNGPKTITVDS
jgi:hypothetical protein